MWRSRVAVQIVTKLLVRGVWYGEHKRYVYLKEKALQDISLTPHHDKK